MGIHYAIWFLREQSLTHVINTRINFLFASLKCYDPKQALFSHHAQALNGKRVLREFLDYPK